MQSLPHLCDTGSGQHAGNASDKALLAGGVEAAEALPGLLEVVLLQCMEQACLFLHAILPSMGHTRSHPTHCH